jgi:hypothetical protein
MAIEIDGKLWTEEELDLMDKRLDTQRDTTADGRRCDWRYQGIDYWGDVESMRCINTAIVKVH